MASSCIEPYATCPETTNFARICRIVVDVLRDILWQVLTHEVKSADLPIQVRNYQHKLKSLDGRIKTWLVGISSSSSEIPSAEKFDVSSIYTLIRNLCSTIPTPTTKWGNPPPAGGMTLGDDIERVREFRNTLYGHATQAKLDTADFNKICTYIIDVVSRFDAYFSANCKAMKCSFKSDIDAVLTCSMDKSLEDEYIEKLKEIDVLLDDIKEQVDDTGHEVRCAKEDVIDVKKLVTNASQNVCDVKQDVENTRQEVNNAIQEVGNVKEEVGNVNKKVGDVEENVGNVKQDLINVQQEVPKITQKVDYVQQEVDSVMKKVCEVMENVCVVRQDVGYARQEVGSVKQEVTNVKQEVIHVTETIFHVKQEVSSVKQEIGSVKQKVGSVKKKVDNVKQEVGNVYQKVDNVNQQVGDVNTNWESLHDKVDFLTKDIAEIKDMLKMIPASVEKRSTFRQDLQTKETGLVSDGSYEIMQMRKRPSEISRITIYETGR
ncbi:hypothetical protein ACJMK2_029343, partial [Sinanodonta woodiana]